MTAPFIAKTYASPKMARRRQRIVRIARAILGEGGLEALTINRLSEEADVAPSTIYRSFESKEGVVLAAMVDHMSGITDFLASSPTRGKLEAIYDEYEWIVAELYRDPGFGKVLIAIYFSGDLGVESYRALRSVAETRITDWIRYADQRGALEDGINRDRIIEFQVDSEYSVLHKWSRGLILRKNLAAELTANFLIAAASIVKQEERADIIERLAKLHAKLGSPPIMRFLDEFDVRDVTND